VTLIRINNETPKQSHKKVIVFQTITEEQNKVLWYGNCSGMCASTVEKGEFMIDRKRSGWRCRTTLLVRTVEGDLRRDARGTIRYETENLGRNLVMVQWDQGFIVPVFPHEIEVFAEEAAHP
jgi:hypothetical protein